MRSFNHATLALAAVAVLVGIGSPLFSDWRLAQRMTPAREPTVPAPSGRFTECFATKLWTADADATSAGRLPKTVRIPAGWTVVGGTTANLGTMPQAAAVVCRDVDAAAAKVLPPAEASGRCSAFEVAQMKDSGMSPSAIDRACAP